MAKSSFKVTKAEDSLGLLLWQTTTLWQRRIKNALKEYNTPHAQFVILAILLWLKEHSKAANQSDIIQFSKLDKMTVSISLKKMVKQGLVKRIEDTTDTRAKQVILTQKGTQRAQTLVPIVEKVDTLFFRNVPDQEQDILISALRTLSRE